MKYALIVNLRMSPEDVRSVKVAWVSLDEAKQLEASYKKNYRNFVGSSIISEEQREVWLS